MKKIIALCMTLMLSLSMLCACGSNSSKSESTTAGSESNASSDLKVAAIFSGPINDGSWNESQYNGLKKIEEAGATINYLENIGDADSAEGARAYAAEGYDLIYLTTNSYQDYCTSVASEYPDTKFVQINGTVMTENFISVKIADEQQGFVQGVIAALLSETGKVGFVGGMEINPIILGSSGFAQGVEYANKTYGLNVTATRVNTGDFTDVNKAKETAIAMIDAGADVIAPMVDDASSGVLEAAEEKQIKAVGSGAGQESFAPTALMTAVIKDVAVAYDATFSQLQAGTLKGEVDGEVEVVGAADGAIVLADWADGVDADIQEKAADVLAKIASGEITVKAE
ncbi:MAG: BMP family protein [Lachnospiraceae bacterium]|nr:BMP family protein [Lachnospiraceae bacterium]